MKQNFLLKSFVLLIALLAGGISAWADPTYHKFTSGGLTVLSTSYVDTWANNTMSGYWMVHNGTASKELSLTDELKTSWNTTESKITFYQVKTSGSKDLTLYFTNVTSITVYSHSNGSSSRTLQYKLNGGKAVNLHEYSSSSFSSDEITGLNASTNYSLQFIASNDVEICAIAVTVPASGKDPSAFALTSETSVTLWKGKTSPITYSYAAGTVTFESSDEDVATVDADGVITAVSEGTAVITVSDSGSETVDGANKTINVTVKEHKNTTTESVAAATGETAILDNSGTISDDTFTLSFEDYPMTIVGDKKFEVGSNNYKFIIGENEYPAVKVSKNGTYVLEPQVGITITSVNVYASSNSTTESGISSGTNEATLAARGTSGTPVAPDAFALSKNDDGKFYFKITGDASQAIVVLEVTYDATQQMTLEIKETGYATLFTDYAVAIPEGVEAFTGKYNAETQTVQLSAVTGTIPASTAVILHTETPGTYSFVKADDVDPIAIANNDLRGTLVEMPVDAQSVYTLGLGGADNTVGMRLYNGTTIRAYSAYMEAPANAAPFFNLGYGDEGTTGIRSIDNGQLTIDNVYYDLAGRRVAQPSKGVYIVNGKKVVIK